MALEGNTKERQGTLFLKGLMSNFCLIIANSSNSTLQLIGQIHLHFFMQLPQKPHQAQAPENSHQDARSQVIT